MSCRVFAYGTIGVRVEADDPTHLDWLAESMTPHVGVADGDAAGGYVGLSHDGARHREMLARGRVPGAERAACFVMDGRVVTHPRWNGPPGTSTVFDEEFRVFYLSDGPGRVEILADGTSPWSRVALFRVLREVLMTGCHRQGRLVVHAAALVVNGRGVILIGPKRAGKTSLLAHGLTHPTARFLANDRAVVSDGDVPPTVRGMPTIVRVRPRMARFFPEIFGGCPRDPDQACLTRAEMASRPPREMPDDAPLVLNPDQFVALFGREQACAAPLQVMVFPRVADGGADRPGRELPLDEAAARLHGALFPALRATHAFAGDAPAPPAHHGDAARRCRRLAERVRCLEWRLGPDAYTGDPGAARFIEALRE